MLEDIKGSLSETLGDRALIQKQKFFKMFTAKYREMLPSLISYRNKEVTSVDFLKTEVALRSGYSVVIGKTTKNNLQVMGFARCPLSSENPVDLFSYDAMNKKDITFIVHPDLIPKVFTEITYADDCKTGDFVVLKNKLFNFQDDMQIIDFYATQLSEIMLSRFSIIMQTKIMTFFLGDIGDETTNKLIEDLFNGNPVSKVSHLFDPKEQIVTVNNGNASAFLSELKREYQNNVSELNNMLGINSLAVDKNSGVSDTEANSNTAFTSSVANICLEARNQPLSKLNKRFGYNLQAVYNDDVASEFNSIVNQNIGGGNE